MYYNFRIVVLIKTIMKTNFISDNPSSIMQVLQSVKLGLYLSCYVNRQSRYIKSTIWSSLSKTLFNIKCQKNLQLIYFLFCE